MTDLANSLEPPVPQDEIDAAAQEAEQPEAKTEPPKQEAPVAEKTVPLAALHEERQRRKELQQQMAREAQERQQRDAILQQRLDQLFAAQNPPPKLRDPRTDPDPVDAVIHNQQLTQAQLQALHNERAQQAAQAQYAAQEQALIGWAQSETARFKSENPEAQFDGAYKHLRDMRVNELAAMGWAPHQIADIVRKDELWLMQNAAQTQQNPAEIVMRMAKATGWGNAPAKVAEVPGEQKIQALQKGTEAAKTLGNGGGPAGKPTAEQIAAMSDEEFAEFKQKQSARGLRMSDAL